MELDAPVLLSVDDLDTLIATLRTDGYRVIGPTVRDGAIVHAELTGVGDLPRGWTDEQGPGSYRLHRRDDDALFGYAVGPSSPRRELLPPRHRLWTAVSDGDVGFRVREEEHVPAKLALLGVRGCELAAIAVQDRVFLHGLYEDQVYTANRQDLLLVAVECGTPSGSCFCASMGTGPGIDGGADLTLTELFDPHRFLTRAGSTRGQELLAQLDHTGAGAADQDERTHRMDAAAEQMGRHLDTTDLHDLLLGNLEHPRWDDVAERCLACTNCTLVCPTCFCTTMEDTTSLTGDEAYRDRRWDSCFALGFSHTGPGSVRSSTRARYRQWCTHKLATWIDQFGTSGCVGCGRCITWCPVGIDITEEVAAIRATDGRRAARTGASP